LPDQRTTESPNELTVAGHATGGSSGSLWEAQLTKGVRVVKEDVVPRSFDLKGNRALWGVGALEKLVAREHDDA
jgi:hypothetical protein